MSAVTKARDTVITSLRGLLVDRLSTGEAVRAHHGKYASNHAAYPPEAVALAESSDEVQHIVRLCAKHGTPMIPFGLGTSLEGHIAALHGGICID